MFLLRIPSRALTCDACSSARFHNHLLLVLHHLAFPTSLSFYPITYPEWRNSEYFILFSIPIKTFIYRTKKENMILKCHFPLAAILAHQTYSNELPKRTFLFVHFPPSFPQSLEVLRLSSRSLLPNCAISNLRTFPLPVSGTVLGTPSTPR